MAAFFTVLGTSIMSDRIKARGPIMAVGTIIAMCGYIMLLVAQKNTVRYGGTFLVAVGVFPGSAMIMVSLAAVLPKFTPAKSFQGWMSNNLAPHYVRATGLGALIAFANLAAFPASFIYRSQDE